MHKNVFATGPPRCGKSTLIQKVVLQIENRGTGFFTREIREKGRRTGFSITTLDGKEGVLAHENMKSGFRVGKYGVNVIPRKATNNDFSLAMNTNSCVAQACNSLL